MSKKKIIIAISAVVLTIVVLAVALVAVVLSTVGKQQKIDYYKMGEDSIPSIKLVVGEKKLSGVSTSTNNGISTKVYEYQSETAQQDANQYTTYLREEEGYRVLQMENQGNVLTYGKESVDAGSIVLVNVDTTPFGYSITIIKGKGEIDLYE